MTLVRLKGWILHGKAGSGGCNYTPDISGSFDDIPMCPQPAVYVMAASRPIYPGARFYVCVEHAAWARSTHPDTIGWIRDVGA